MKIFQKIIIFSLFFFIFQAFLKGDSTGQVKRRVLLLDGQNNHKWKETSPYLKLILEKVGGFQVDVSTTPPGPVRFPKEPVNPTPEQTQEYQELIKKLKEGERLRVQSASENWSKWHPRFSDYDVVVSNYNGENWPESVSKEFVSFVENGGGFVSVHAANNSFAKWKEYNEMIGIGGWGGRNETAGPFLQLKEGKWIPDPSPGQCAKHTHLHEFLVKTFDAEHPIMKGLPREWMHAKDELYYNLRGNAKNLSVLAYATTPSDLQDRPILMAIQYGKGRVFHTTLGDNVEAMKGLGFQITLVRGTEWAISGAVTFPAVGAEQLKNSSPAATGVLQ